MDVFHQVSYNSRQRYLSKKSETFKDQSHMLFFKTFKNPLFNNVCLKELFSFHLGGDFDVTICYKATPNIAKFVVR